MSAAPTSTNWRISTATAPREFITLVHRCCDGFRRLAAPVIARIDGFALGAGLELAAACDLRVASERSMFGMPEVRVGIPSVVEAALLPALIGSGRARRLLLTGETIGASEALDWGLVDAVAPPDGLDAAVERFAAAILAGGPRAIRLQKALILDWEDMSTSAAIAQRHRRLRRGLSTPTSRTAWRPRVLPKCGRAARCASRADRHDNAAKAERQRRSRRGFPIPKPRRRIITDTASGCASA